MNGFDIKRYYKGYTIDNDTIRLQEHLDLNGYKLRNFRPKIISFGEWKAGENVESSKTYVKFGNSTYIMAERGQTDNKSSSGGYARSR